MNTTTGAKNVRWDLSPMYRGIDDPQLDADLAEWLRLATAFASFRGQLKTRLGAAIAAKTELSCLANKMFVYLYLLQSTDRNNEKVKSKMASMEKEHNAAAGTHLEFFPIEVVALTDEEIASQAATDDTVRKYLPWLANIRLMKPHLLSEEVEGALTKYGQFGAGTWGEFYREAEADLRFPWKGSQLTLTEIFHLMSESTDAAERAEVLRVCNAGLGGPFLKLSAQTLAMIAGQKEVDDRERGFAGPMTAINLHNRIPDAVVEALHDTVRREGAPLVRRFYKLKAKLLGLERLGWGDRNAKMPFGKEDVVPWDKAVSTAVNCYERFSPTLAGLLRASIEQKLIDAPPAAGKQGGAYNYSLCLPGNKPLSYVFLNYLGSVRDVMTLAHEWGHYAHGMLAGEAQGVLLLHAPIPYAETASVFGEMTTFNALKADIVAAGDDERLLALCAGKLDDMMNTVVRQISFSNFERKVHGLGRRATIAELTAFWKEATTELYGEDGDAFTYENIDNLWSYVHHFHTPFYVYGYAFGELLTQSLYATQSRFGEKFEPMYLDLLRAGGSKGVVELLQPFGLDPTHADFWANGIRVGVGALLDDAEAAAKRLGKL